MLAVAYGETVEIRDRSGNVLNIIANLSLQRHVPPIWSPDGQRLAIYDKPLIAIWRQPWDSTIATAAANVLTNGDAVTALTWNPSGTKIAVVQGQGVDIHDLINGSMVSELFSDWGLVRDIVWPVEDQLLITTSDHATGFWDISSGALISSFYVSNSYIVYTRALSLDPTGTRVAIADEDGIIHIWNTTQPNQEFAQEYEWVFYHPTSITDLEWDPSGDLIAVAGGPTIQVWRMSTRELVDTYDIGDLSLTQMASLAWNPVFGSLTFGEVDGNVRTIEVAPWMPPTPTFTPAGPTETPVSTPTVTIIPTGTHKP